MRSVVGALVEQPPADHVGLDVGDRGFAALPEHFHEPELGLSQGWRLLSGHSFAIR